MSRLVKKEILVTPKGTRDLFSDELFIRKKIHEKCREIAEYYGFQEIQTPHFEHSEIFEASLGAASDIVEKQMYTFRTRGGDQLTLRPEGTVPIVRAYFEDGMLSWPQPVMLYYVGSFFRHESPQKGRFREFGQFGLEILGEDLAVAEATIIRIFSLILKELGLEAALELNTIGDKECRPAYRKDLIAYYRKHVNYLCKDCKRRLKENPLRLLDCKEESCVELKKNAPQMIEYVCDNCKAHFKEVLDFMDAAEIPYSLNPYLVRGLDYYTRTVFEFVIPPKTPEEKRMEIGGGGRYDYLGDLLAGKPLAAVGGAFGVDRLSELLKEKDGFAEGKRPKVFLIQLGEVAKKKSLCLIEEFRKAKIPLAQSLSKDSLRGQLRLASKLEVDFSLILGQKEAMDGTIIIREMDSGVQEIIPFPKVIDRIKTKAKN
ncbi:histidine--tRNA ligase [Candidatus Giovannonibacteria bacterium]|nr:histidine--tRNA ligase [Candidatus Giovannonibacteria bacterium]